MWNISILFYIISWNFPQVSINLYQSGKGNVCITARMASVSRLKLKSIFSQKALYWSDIILVKQQSLCSMINNVVTNSIIVPDWLRFVDISALLNSISTFHHASVVRSLWKCMIMWADDERIFLSRYSVVNLLCPSVDYIIERLANWHEACAKTKWLSFSCCLVFVAALSWRGEIRLILISMIQPHTNLIITSWIIHIE